MVVCARLRFQELDASKSTLTARTGVRETAVEGYNNKDTEKRDAETRNAARESELSDVERRLAIEKAKPKPKTFDAGAGAQKGAARRRGPANEARSPSGRPASGLKSPTRLREQGSRVLRKQFTSGRNLVEQTSTHSSVALERLKQRLPSRKATARAPAAAKKPPELGTLSSATI